MSFGKGCLQPLIAPHLHRMSFRMHTAMVATLPSSVDLRETGLVAAVKDQGQVGACEGFSCSGATETAFALAGDPLGFTPSEAAWYRGLRAIARARSTPAGQPLPSLQDVGGMTEDAIAFMAAFGIRPRYVARTSDGRNADLEIAAVNDEPGLGELETEAIRLFVGPYAVDPQSSDAEQQVQASLAAKIPVRVDSFVDSAYEDWTPSQAPVGAPNTSDPQGGGHAQYIVGYAPGFYIVRNSWGTAFGDAGDWRVSPTWLRSTWGLYPWTCKRAS